MYAIHHPQDVQRLTGAAQTVLEMICDGRMFHPVPADDVIQAADKLESATEQLVKANTRLGISPALHYRAEITAATVAGTKLRELVRHLENDHNPLQLASLLDGSDQHTVRIALELIAAYARFGRRDHHLIALAEHLRLAKAA